MGRRLENGRTFERAGVPRLWMSAWRVGRKPSRRKTIRRRGFLSSHRSRSLLVMSRNYWNLKSCWSIKRPRYPLDQFVTWLLEHEVVVSGGPPHVQVVAKFVHALLNTRIKRGYIIRGGLVSLRIRKRWSTKRLDVCKKVELVICLKGHSA